MYVSLSLNELNIMPNILSKHTESLQRVILYQGSNFHWLPANNLSTMDTQVVGYLLSVRLTACCQ